MTNIMCEFHTTILGGRVYCELGKGHGGPHRYIATAGNHVTITEPTLASDAPAETRDEAMRRTREIRIEGLRGILRQCIQRYVTHPGSRTQFLTDLDDLIETVRLAALSTPVVEDE